MKYVFLVVLTVLIAFGLKLVIDNKPNPNAMTNPHMKAFAKSAIESFVNGFFGGFGFVLAIYILFLMFGYLITSNF